jgi:hypothetical protein
VLGSDPTTTSATAAHDCDPTVCPSRSMIVFPNRPARGVADGTRSSMTRNVSQTAPPMESCAVMAMTRWSLRSRSSSVMALASGLAVPVA